MSTFLLHISHPICFSTANSGNRLKDLSEEVFQMDDSSHSKRPTRGCRCKVARADECGEEVRSTLYVFALVLHYPNST